MVRTGLVDGSPGEYRGSDVTGEPSWGGSTYAKLLGCGEYILHVGQMWILRNQKADHSGLNGDPHQKMCPFPNPQNM